MGKAILFADSLLGSRPDPGRRGWSTLASFTLQALIATALLILPIFRPTGLPALRQISTPISLGEPGPEGPAFRPHRGAPVAPAHPAVIVFRKPSQIPSIVASPGDYAAPAMPSTGPYIPGIAGSGDRRGISGLFTEGTRPVLPPALPRPAPSHFRISHIDEGNLLRKVQPLYPPLARSARIQGVVVFASDDQQGRDD